MSRNWTIEQRISRFYHDEKRKKFQNIGSLSTDFISKEFQFSTRDVTWKNYKEKYEFRDTVDNRRGSSMPTLDIPYAYPEKLKQRPN